MNEAIFAVEESRQREQSLIDHLKSRKEKNASGQFATPAELALDISKYVNIFWTEKGEKVKFLEPAFGLGSFYSALIQSLSSSVWQKSNAIEIDPALVRNAKKLWSGYNIRIIQGDFTALSPPSDEREKFNLIVTNPPYIRHHHIKGSEKLRLQKLISEQLDLKINGLAGLYCYYVLLAHRWLCEGGLGVWLIPSEFMDVNYGSVLRRYFTREVTLERIHRFDPTEVQFSDALVSSSVVVFSKTRPIHSDLVSFSYGGTLDSPRQVKRITIEQLARLSKWNETIFQPSSSKTSDHIAHTLSEFFQIKRGVATGDNTYFILPLEEAEKKIPIKFLTPILPSPRNIKNEVIDSDAEGLPVIDRRVVLIDCDLEQKEVQANYPDFWHYLELGIERGVNKGYLARKRNPWYLQEQRKPAPFLCSYMGRKTKRSSPFRFFWNKSRAIAPNSFQMLYPRGLLADALSSDLSLYEKVFRSLQEINSERMIEAGRVYGGGLHKLEPSELGNVPASRLFRFVKSRSLDA